jgi:putative flippase GtrA
MFGIVGAAATATHYVVALLAHQAAALNLYVANLLGYGCAVGISFFGHGKLTFQTPLSERAFGRFVIVSVSGLFLSEAMLAVLRHGWHFSATVSLAVVVMLVPALSFTLNKFWVYRCGQTDPVLYTQTVCADASDRRE